MLFQILFKSAVKARLTLNIERCCWRSAGTSQVIYMYTPQKKKSQNPQNKIPKSTTKNKEQKITKNPKTENPTYQAPNDRCGRAGCDEPRGDSFEPAAPASDSETMISVQQEGPKITPPPPPNPQNSKILLIRHQMPSAREPAAMNLQWILASPLFLFQVHDLCPAGGGLCLELHRFLARKRGRRGQGGRLASRQGPGFGQ